MKRSLLGLAMVLMGHSRAFAQHPDTLTISDLTVAHVAYTADSNAVRRELGAPTRSFRDKKPNDDGIRLTHWTYGDLRIAFDTNGYVYTMEMDGPGHVTARNIKVGASIQAVRRAYGEPLHSDGHALVYTLSSSEFETSGIAFFFEKGVLKRIILGQVISVE
jgi:hypothetical protein